MKRLFLILIASCCCIHAVAELTIREVFQKSVEAADITKGMKGTCTVSAMGEKKVLFFETNGKRLKVHDEEDVSYVNIADSVCYSYEKATNTLTISDGKMDIIPIFPYMMALGIAKGKMEELELLKDSKMTKRKTEYEVDIDGDGVHMIILIDATTFHIKEMKMKKFFITLMSMQYAGIAPFSDFGALEFDKAKYPTAKVIDERKE